jgi:hypothetical protein
MLDVEILRPAPLDALLFEEVVVDASRYALLSIAFTTNRLDKTDLKQRIINIVKGKVAESLFYHYLDEQASIKIDKDSTATPYWLADNRDFIFLNGEWDIKNNFISSTEREFKNLSVADLPALIPDRHPYDQWSKRDVLYNAHTTYSAYVFTFMRLQPKNKHFLTLQFSSSLEDLIIKWIEKYCSWSYGHLHQVERMIWEQIFNIDTMRSLVKIEYQPDMMITACANRRYWNRFLPCDPGSMLCNNLYKTIIPNQYCTVSNLPAFAQLIVKR